MHWPAADKFIRDDERRLFILTQLLRWLTLPWEFEFPRAGLTRLWRVNKVKAR
jgi:hypothetical protein